MDGPHKGKLRHGRDKPDALQATHRYTLVFHRNQKFSMQSDVC